jgi:succinate dehydrogenase / fumarate reductase iron-sulfur subunit
VQKFKIYRWDPESGANPRYDTFEIDLDDCGPMVLDALIKIKNEVDPTLTFPPLVPRGHLRLVLDEHERPQRPRLHHRDGGPQGEIRITPLPHMEVVKDLVPDFSNFYAQYASIRPWLQTVTTTRAARSGCRAPSSARSSTGSTSASCARAARPRARATGGTRTSSSARRSCCRPTAGSPTAATR